jgi:hypothetical protein
MMHPPLPERLAADRMEDRLATANKAREARRAHVPFRTPAGSGEVVGATVVHMRRLIGLVVRGWQDSVYLHQQLIDAQRPWDHEGPLRWQGGSDGWRIVGARLPDQE